MAVDAPITPIGYVSQSYGSSTNSWWMYDGESTPELRWPQSVEVYDAMRTQDAQVGSVLEAVVRPILRTTWRLNPAGARPEVVEFVADDLGLPIVGENPDPPPRTKDRFSWLEHLELALLMLPFGHSYFEQIYRVDDDGKRAHLGKLEPRMPRTIDKIDVARDGGLISITQCGTLDYGIQKPIPVARLVAYIYKREGGNWLGRSILRQAYKNWLIKDRLLRVQAQTIERNGMGIPRYTDAEGATPDQHTAGLALAKAWRSGEAAGAAIPFGSKLDLVGVSGTLPEAQPAINYHDNQIARAVLAHFLNLGQESGTGSYALGVTFADFFTASLQTLAQQIADVATQHIVEDLVDVNWGSDEPAPKIVFDEIGSRQQATAQSLVALFGAGALTPDARLEESLRQQYGLPPLDPETARGENAINIPGSPAAEAPPEPTPAGAPPEDQEWVTASAEVDEDAFLGAALIQALVEVTGRIHAKAGPDFESLHPRGPGGKFRDVVDRIVNALGAWSRGLGPSDPMPEDKFTRDHLRAAAVHIGVKVKPGASRDDLHDLILNDVREATHTQRQVEKPTDRFTLQHPPHAGKDVQVHKQPNGDAVELVEVNDAGQRRRNPLERFDSIHDLQHWAEEHDESRLATWAGQRAAEAGPRKATPAKPAPAKGRPSSMAEVRRELAGLSQAERKERVREWGLTPDEAERLTGTPTPVKRAKATEPAKKAAPATKVAPVAQAAKKAAPPAVPDTSKRATKGSAPSADEVSRYDETLRSAAAGDEALAAAPTLVQYDEAADKWTATGVPAKDQTRTAAAVHTYWDVGQDLNEYLRDGAEAYPKRGKKLTAARAKRTVDALGVLYDQSRLDRPVVAYRGLGGRTLFGGDPDAWPDDLAGMEWTDDGLVSTSVDRSTAENFVTGGSAGAADRRGVFARILMPEGAPVLSLAEFEDGELVAAPGTRFRVVRDGGWEDVQTTSGVRRQRVLDVEAIPPESAGKTPVARKAAKAAPAKKASPAGASPRVPREAPKKAAAVRGPEARFVRSASAARVAGRDRVSDIGVAAREIVRDESQLDRTRRQKAGNLADTELQAIGRIQGFDAPPSVGSKEQVDAAVASGWVEMWRGSSTAGGLPPVAIAERFRSGDYAPGFGEYGNGYYATVSRDNALVYTAPTQFPPFVTDESGLVRMALNPDARVLEVDDPAAALREEQVAAGVDPSDRSPAGRVLSDLGHLAAAQGYDALVVRGQPDGAGGEPVDQYVIFNRSAVIAEAGTPSQTIAALQSAGNRDEARRILGDASQAQLDALAREAGYRLWFAATARTLAERREEAINSLVGRKLDSEATRYGGSSPDQILQLANRHTLATMLDDPGQLRRLGLTRERVQRRLDEGDAAPPREGGILPAVPVADLQPGRVPSPPGLVSIDETARPKIADLTAGEMARDLVDRREGHGDPALARLSDDELRTEVDRRIKADPMAAQDVDMIPGWRSGEPGDGLDSMPEPQLRSYAQEFEVPDAKRRNAAGEYVKTPGRIKAELRAQGVGGPEVEQAKRRAEADAEAAGLDTDPAGASGLSDDPAIREVQVENRIRAAWKAVIDRQLAEGRRRRVRSEDEQWVKLVDLRAQLGDDIDRREVDQALTRISRDRGSDLIAELNQKTLTPADREAAVMIGGQPDHLISFQGDGLSPKPLPARGSAPRTAPPRVASTADLDLTGNGPSGLSADTLVRKVQIQNRIRAAWRDSPVRKSGDWVPLRDIRAKLGSLDLGEVDEALRDLARQRNTSLTRLMGTTTEADDEAAVEFGGVPQHGLVLEDVALRLQPLPSPAESRAVSRQSSIDSARTVADTLSEIAQLQDSGASTDALLSRIEGRRGRGLPDAEADRLVAAVQGAREVEVENRIRAAYAKLRPTGGWTAIADIRDELADLPREDVDAALRAMTRGDSPAVRDDGWRFIEIANAKALTPRDRAAALRQGGQNLSAVQLRDPSPRSLPDLASVRDDLAREHNLTPIGAPGSVSAFNPASMEMVGGGRPPAEGSGSRVRVVRPGYSAMIDGERVQLSKAVVEVEPNLSDEGRTALERLSAGGGGGVSGRGLPRNAFRPTEDIDGLERQGLVVRDGDRYRITRQGEDKISPGAVVEVDTPPPAAAKRQRGQRRVAPWDPFPVYLEGGEAGLRERLGELDLEGLRDIVAGGGMDRTGQAMKWRDRDRVTDLIVERVADRSTKGDAFHPRPPRTTPAAASPAVAKAARAKAAAKPATPAKAAKKAAPAKKAAAADPQQQRAQRLLDLVKEGKTVFFKAGDGWDIVGPVDDVQIGTPITVIRQDGSTARVIPTRIHAERTVQGVATRTASFRYEAPGDDAPTTPPPTQVAADTPMPDLRPVASEDFPALKPAARSDMVAGVTVIDAYGGGGRFVITGSRRVGWAAVGEDGREKVILPNDLGRYLVLPPR